MLLGGAHMTFRPMGRGGDWVLDLYGKTAVVACRDQNVNTLDDLYVAKVPTPTTCPLGGGVARDDVTGRWVSVDRTGYANEIADPYAQVRSSKHALLHKLKDHPSIGHSWVGMGHGVVLPDSADPHRPLAPDAPAEITVYAEDMGRIATAPTWS